MTIHISTLIGILFIHWIFDFVLQTRYMANNKSKCNIALLFHVSVYFVGLYIFSMINFNDNFPKGISFVLCNTVAHFFTDYLTSRVTSSLYKENKIHEFFAVIGFDQFIHIATLCGTYVIFKNL